MIKLIFGNKKLVGVSILTTFLTCIQVSFEFLIPTFMGFIIQIVNDPMRQTLLIDIVVISLYIILVALGSIIMGILISWIASRATANTLAKMRHNLYKKISSFSLNELNQFGVSSLITRTTNDVTVVGDVLVSLLHNMSHGPLLVIGALVFLIIEGCNYELILIIVAAVLLLSTSIFIGAKIVIPRFFSIEKLTDDVSSINKENLEGLRIVRAYNAEAFQEAKIDSVNKKLAQNDRFTRRALGCATPVIQFITGIVTLSLTLVSAYLIRNPKTTFSYEQTAVIIQFGSLLLSGLVTIVIIVALVPRASICVERINQVLSTDSIIKDNGNVIKGKQEGTIAFKNVTFVYPNEKTPSIKNISFKINQGETIAFIGATGAGKTTIVNLLLRLYEPQSGTILVDDVDIKKYPLNILRKKIAWVPQKSYLFHDTVKNNVCLGKPNATNEDITQALDISQSNEFVKKMNSGLNFKISPGGKNVSGGQRQRLCIARALICKSEILVLDDSFSSLDYKTVKLISSSIRKYRQNTTSIIISQRVSAIMHADKIVVIDKGKIVGYGPHRQLLKSSTIYRDFATAQLSKKELGL